jgi:hypothetical protein
MSLDVEKILGIKAQKETWEPWTKRSAGKETAKAATSLVRIAQAIVPLRHAMDLLEETKLSWPMRQHVKACEHLRVV